MTSASILIVAPTKRELGGLRESDVRAAIRQTDRESAPRIQIVLCGIGREAGARIGALLDAAPCSLIVSLGFAGALDPTLRPGDLIAANVFLLADAPPLAPPDPLLPPSSPSFPHRRESRGGAAPDSLSLQGERDGERALATMEVRSPAPDPLSALKPLHNVRSALTRRFAASSPLVGRGGFGACAPAEPALFRRREPAPPYPAGAVLTVDEPILAVGGKRRARAASGAAVVDMEGRRIAEAAIERGIPIVAVRAVLDEAAFALPPFVAEIAAAGGGREWALALRGAASPRSAVRMLPLALRARKAARSLRRAAAAILAAQQERP